jgi:cGMP-dependent protein kinase
MGVVSEHTSVEAALSARVFYRPKSAQDIELIMTCLSQHFIFSNLVDDAPEHVANQMHYLTIDPHELIFEQRQHGSHFFILETGTVEIIVNDSRVTVLRRGSCFGELALLHNSPRSATVRSLERCTLWVLDRNTFRKAVEQISEVNYNENMHFVNSVPLFRLLTAFQKESLVGSLTLHKFKQGQVILNENDPGELLYIIKEGQISCTQGNSEIRRMGPGDFFGEQALLYDSARTATITAIGATVKCLSVNRSMLKAVLGDSLDQVIYKNSLRIAFESSTTLSNLTKEQQDRLINKMKVVKYEQGQVVIRKTTLRSSELLVLLKGSLVEKDTQREVVSSISCLGDDVVVEACDSSVYQDDVVAEVNCSLSRISMLDFELAIGGTFDRVSEKNEVLRVLRSVQLLRGLGPARLEALSKALVELRFEPNDEIVKQHTEGNCLFILREGSVDVKRDNIKIRAITKFDYFGERSVLFNDFRSASVIATSTVVVWAIPKETFLELITRAIRHRLLCRIQLQDEVVPFHDLVSIDLIGKGSFGVVQLVCHRENRNVYALKAVSRQTIELHDLHASLLYERQILLALDHVMILKLAKTFKDSERVYFLMEYVRGEVLSTVIRRTGLISQDDAKFYAACLLVTLMYLHDRSIIYRDLKPENVIVDEEGFTKLVDFGVSKIVDGRTYTVVGTPHYMAPEVITRKGYSYAADYWSLGVMLYEFLCGKVPFGEEEHDPYECYKQTLENELKFPDFIDEDSPAAQLVKQLLASCPAARLGGSPSQLLSHRWFQGIDWVRARQDLLVSRQMRPPYIPPTRDLTEEIEESIIHSKSPAAFFAVDCKQNEETEFQKPKVKGTKSAAGDWDAEF